MTDASVLNVGTQCFYRKRDGTVATAVVLKVHHDEQPPYYTIGIDATEREKQTEREKLRPCSQGPWPEAQVTPEVTRQLSVKSVAALDKLARRSPDAHALFRQIDKNGDGAITVRELCEFFVSTDDAFARRLFKAIDIDDDGLIDIDEFRLAHKTATERRNANAKPGQPGPQAHQVPHPRPPAPVASQSHSVPVNTHAERDVEDC